MSYSYYSQALLQEMLHISNQQEADRLVEEIDDLKSMIFSRQKKHRRCDKDISKTVNVNFILIQCRHC